MLATKFIYSNNIKYNLIIGGVYPNTIANETDLANLFTFNESDIKVLVFDGNNIKAQITSNNYSGNFEAFRYNTDITSIIEKGNLTRIGNNALANCPNLNYVELTGNLDLSEGNTTFYQCGNLSANKINLPNIQQNPAMRSLFRQIKGDGTVLDLTMLTSVVNTSFYSNNTFEGSNCIVDMRNVTDLIVTFLNSNTGMFYNFLGERIRLWSLTNMMSDPAIISGVFGTQTTSMVIEINYALATVNAGVMHADLADAQSRGATIIWTNSQGQHTDTNGNLI